MDNRWWLAVSLTDSFPNGQVNISFEFNIPKEPGTNVSIQFIEEYGLITAAHRGLFTVGLGAVSIATFFDYYHQYPDRWPVMEHEGRQYLKLFSFDLNNFNYRNLYDFLSTCADFAEYITWYKDEQRDR